MLLLPEPIPAIAWDRASGNFAILPVSNHTEDARTSHPCESGAGFASCLSAEPALPKDTRSPHRAALPQRNVNGGV